MKYPTIAIALVLLSNPSHAQEGTASTPSPQMPAKRKNLGPTIDEHIAILNDSKSLGSEFWYSLDVLMDSDAEPSVVIPAVIRNLRRLGLTCTTSRGQVAFDYSGQQVVHGGMTLSRFGKWCCSVEYVLDGNELESARSRRDEAVRPALAQGPPPSQWHNSMLPPLPREFATTVPGDATPEELWAEIHRLKEQVQQLRAENDELRNFIYKTLHEKGPCPLPAQQPPPPTPPFFKGVPKITTGVQVMVLRQYGPGINQSISRINNGQFLLPKPTGWSNIEVRVLSKDDQRVVANGITNTDGELELELQPGEYTVTNVPTVGIVEEIKVKIEDGKVEKVWIIIHACGS